MTPPIKISVDGMGGDYAPENIVAGAVQAISELDIQVALVGVEDRLKEELKKRTVPAGRIEIVHAPDVVAMDEQATTAVRKKKNSSMRKAVDLAVQGQAQAIISAGNTGAFYAMVKFAVGELPGVDRLPLAALFPHPNGRSIVLDVGANVDSKARHLLEFALMGSVYAQEILGIPEPKVGLLSIGSEAAKGNDLTREAFPLLKASDLNFIGNVEGHDLFKGTADVVVCDGFTGNVALKTSESMIETIFHLLQPEIEHQPRIAQVLTKYFDYSEFGGAPLLGAKIPSFVCHGRSSPKAIKNAIRVAVEFCRNNVNERIHRKLELMKV
ncbi:MAG TPA: phosphate acyltransferase PlsX [Acidobacteriota bacterium]|nr:phosphate acyltransferase PlsX [Acidobacteriota bacterium]